jgi:uncharacterized protein (DUF1697 family)
LVVFMRAVNVGGHQVFRPSLLAKQLSHLGVINLGAAGTFVVPGPIGQQALQAEVQRRLPFPAELMICTAREVVDLVSRDPFPAGPGADVRRFVSVLGRRPARRPTLPVADADGGRWQVKIVALSGRFALSLYRRLGPRSVDINHLVEKHFNQSATTRNWNTMCKIRDVLKAGAGADG